MRIPFEAKATVSTLLLVDELDELSLMDIVRFTKAATSVKGAIRTAASERCFLNGAGEPSRRRPTTKRQLDEITGMESALGLPAEQTFATQNARCEYAAQDWIFRLEHRPSRSRRTRCDV